MPESFGIVTWLNCNSSASNIRRCMAEQLRLARSRGYIVEVIYVDAEKGLQKLKGWFDGVHVDIAGAGQHVPVAEARVKLIKNVCRIVRSGVPWKIPLHKVKDLVFYANNRVNIVPSMTSEDASTLRERFCGYKLDAKKDLTLGFGDYCEVFNSPNSSLVNYSILYQTIRWLTEQCQP